VAPPVGVVGVVVVGVVTAGVVGVVGVVTVVVAVVSGVVAVGTVVAGVVAAGAVAGMVTVAGGGVVCGLSSSVTSATAIPAATSASTRHANSTGMRQLGGGWIRVRAASPHSTHQL